MKKKRSGRTIGTKGTIKSPSNELESRYGIKDKYAAELFRNVCTQFSIKKLQNGEIEFCKLIKKESIESGFNFDPETVTKWIHGGLFETVSESQLSEFDRGIFKEQFSSIGRLLVANILRGKEGIKFFRDLAIFIEKGFDGYDVVSDQEIRSELMRIVERDASWYAFGELLKQGKTDIEAVDILENEKSRIEDAKKMLPAYKIKDLYLCFKYVKREMTFNKNQYFKNYYDKNEIKLRHLSDEEKELKIKNVIKSQLVVQVPDRERKQISKLAKDLGIKLMRDKKYFEKVKIYSSH